MDHMWYPGGFVLVGFKTGYVVVISAERGDQIDELSHFRYHTKSLDMLAVHYDQKKFVATTSNNLSINLWDTQNYTACFSIPTDDIQMCIKWCASDINLIFTGGLDCTIHAYDPKRESNSD